MDFRKWMEKQQERIRNKMMESGVQDIIARKGKKFMNEFGQSYNNGNFMWIPIRNFGSIKTFKVLKSKKESFIRKDVDDFISDYSKKTFGWDFIKDGTYVGSYKNSRIIGKPHIFIPLGNYKYLWTSMGIIKDLKPLWKTKKPFTDDYKNEVSFGSYDKFHMENSNLGNYLPSLTERWEGFFRCKEYIVMNEDFMS